MNFLQRIKLAQLIITIGLAPFIIVVALETIVIMTLPLITTNVGGSDVFSFVFLGVVTYSFALLVAGPGVVWLTLLIYKNAALRSVKATVLVVVAILIFLSPLIWNIWFFARH